MPLNVLIVDDSAVTRAMILKVLQAAELPLGEVHQRGDGRAGLEALEGHWIDLIFTDLNMPVMTGEEMIDQVRAHPVWKDLPVVVVSSDGSQTRMQRLLEKKVRFIHKPFTPEQLRDVVTSMLGIQT